EEALTEPLVELGQRVEVVAQLVGLAANLDGHVAPLSICHGIPPSEMRWGGTVAAPSLVLDRRLFARGLERDAEDKASLKLRRNPRVHDHSLELLGLSPRGMVDLEGQRLPHR